jgi:cytochrome c peroxidase
MKIRIFFLAVAIIAILSCRKGTTTPPKYTPTPYQLQIPKRFPPPFISADNPLTVEGVTLGRMFYYDPILSTNGRSCSSCHAPANSFSSGFFTTGTGEKMSIPPHINLAFNPDYLWDGSGAKLDPLCLSDFGPDFFNTDMPDLYRKLKAHPIYPDLFKKAFGVENIDKLSNDELQLKIVYAISQFIRTLVSSDSRYDRMLRHEIAFTAQELDGMQTFFTERGDCFHCHDYPLFTSNTFHNTGLDSLPEGLNLGRFLFTKDEQDKGKFSAPTLRNIELTAPYMHDARFNTLEEVVEFYNSGVHWTSPSIDPLMTKPAKKYGLGLTPAQKSNLVKFLQTLTDTTFLNNPAYKSPF